jgi:septum site-determining protein MinD
MVYILKAPVHTLSMGRSIVVSSGKGGVGKTHFVINLGVALTKIGKNVAVIDGALTTPDISLHLGIPFHVRGLSHILRERASIESASYKHTSGLTIIPGNIHVDVLREIKGKKFATLLKKLKKDYDYVLVDSSAGLGAEATSSIKHCDSMLVITNPEISSVVHSSKTIQIAKSLRVSTLGIVLNRVGRFRKELGDDEITPLMHNVPIIGKISEDSRLPISTYYAGSVLDYYPHSTASNQFLHLAYHVSGVAPKAESSFIGRISSYFQKDPRK